MLLSFILSLLLLLLHLCNLEIIDFVIVVDIFTSVIVIDFVIVVNIFSEVLLISLLLSLLFSLLLLLHFAPPKNYGLNGRAKNWFE